MNIFKQHFLILVALGIPALLSGQTTDLAKNFINPPKEYSLLPFWSWNGTLKPEKLTWQIDQMMDKGIYGAFLHARGGLDESETPYFSEGFWKAVDTTIGYSASKGFQTYLYDEDKWPSGSAGGRTIAANPDEFIKKVLFYDKMEVIGPQSIILNFQKNPMAIFAGRISENGNYDYSSQVNLTDKNGAQWSVPKGRWAIISFEMVKDPGAQIDYLDSAAVAEFIKITHEEYFKRYGNYFGNTIPGIFFDEIYANYSKMTGNIFWTDDFLLKFRKIKGYELTDNLPLIIYKDPDKSGKVRYDYFDVVKELYVKAWFKQYADWCAAHKIFATGHTTEKLIHYIRQSDYFSTMGQLQVPGTDNEEYRYGFPRMIDWYNPIQISSIAHLYNRKRVLAEALGSGGYTIPLEEYRYGLSMLGVYGINMFVPHLFHYTMDTPESQSDWPPSWFFTNPYWKYFKPLADFGSRISYMNSQGNAVCDVAILYPLTDLWESGYPEKVDDTFYKEVQQELLNNHIDYDIIDPASLVKATIEGRKIVAGTGKYRVLVMPAIQAIRQDVLQKITSFVEEGGIVIGLKNLPATSESGTGVDELVAAKVKDLFGFPPSSLKPEEYYQWNNEQTNRFTSRTNKSGGSAFFTRFLSQLPEIINSNINPDFEVKSNNSGYLRFNHRRIDATEIYLLVNDRNSPEKYQISLRNIGIPSIWSPETGGIIPYKNYQMTDGRMELILDFKPHESYFLVLGPGKPDSSRVLVERKERTNQVLPDINIVGEWQFQLVPHALDYNWSSSLESDTLALPIMKFQPERLPNEGLKNHWSATNFDDTGWKTVKIQDEFNKKPGIQRYMSGWDGWWISYYDYSMHIPDIEGGERSFKKEIHIDAAVKDAKITITADKGYEFLVNGKIVGSDNDWKVAETYDISGMLKPGNNILEVRTKQTRGLLLQGSIRMKNVEIIALRSDDTWMVSDGKEGWRPSFMFAAPPLGSWGNIDNPSQKDNFPLTVWYRQQLPPGAVAIKKPVIKGDYSLYINGIRANVVKGENIINIARMMKKDVNEIALSVNAGDYTYGLIKPVEVVCGKVNSPLISWNNMGLGWYSGRALYIKKVDVPSNFIQQGTRLVLNLGKVNYFAEIWVNNKLVTFCPWAPFEADISGFVKAGENEISLVVANLQANQATWNILDDNITNKAARWWHYGSIQREKEKLVSGLLGPVRIIPYNLESAEIENK
ncbi:MAG: glycosyl hydrolase [Bacteroidia bacterium]|nr:glycosyl hydrolase [Bacteroidia bacterium]